MLSRDKCKKVGMYRMIVFFHVHAASYELPEVTGIHVGLAHMVAL